MNGIVYRKASEKDIDRLIELNIRLKRLNEEFDPLFKLREDIVEKSREYFQRALNSPDSVVVVAEDGGRVVGFIKADVVERLFYEPKIEGNIVEFYLLPEYRRKKLGAAMLDYVIKLLKERVDIITAEFPALNEIAVEFYSRLGFRGIVSTYARES
ncbi:MAG: GNAT family N-acetyltransferase [Candidatus Caldarchaeum sp.]|nr:GNAT family N-acetyltransferase [Candidatus Caldarchaeum sp.]MCX8200739.1 GNAT family N-acetyltransferase [Candidatus Caldarchaeum sp.]MDW8062746.1 GNAT family N-acetyltransferase [Candidatus Caldarchaeum sp.]MDW8434648.1 GNAT family N-acetyltransferase [Candidatus Caldarchaeum sp.]